MIPTKMAVIKINKMLYIKLALVFNLKTLVKMTMGMEKKTGITSNKNIVMPLIKTDDAL